MTSEKDIAVLIPSYKKPEMTIKAVKSALATGAGEVIVSENDPDTDIFEVLKNFNDDRLKIFHQPQNVGIWKNHFFLTKQTQKPWIKFLQADDFITPDCLQKMSFVITETTSIICAHSTYYNIQTEELRRSKGIEEPLVWSSAEYMQRLKEFGNELARPTNILVRADSLEKNEEAWENDKSADLIMNVMAASKGDVIILPHGLIYIALHAAQDTFFQDFKLIQHRLKNTLLYLKSKNIKEVNDFIHVYGTVEAIGLLRIMLSHIKNKKKFFYSHLLVDFFSLLNITGIINGIKKRKSIIKYYKYKFNKDQVSLKID